MSDKPLSYSSYLHIDELLAQQQPKSAEHDELLFIIIHQVYELWFKQVLHELDGLNAALAASDAPRALAALKRVLTIFKTLVGQVDILETMTPLSFNSFRARLEASSGFQSAQFRELEFVLGHRRAGIAEQHPEPVRSRLAARLSQPSVYDHFLHYLKASGWNVPDSALARDVSQPAAANDAVQDLLVQVYQKGELAAQLCERLVDLDEGLQEWRYRHVKMVERTIGNKPGTGGSAGVEYLRSTLFQSLFPDLWAIRARL